MGSNSLDQCGLHKGKGSMRSADPLKLNYVDADLLIEC